MRTISVRAVLARDDVARYLQEAQDGGADPVPAGVSRRTSKELRTTQLSVLQGAAALRSIPFCARSRRSSEHLRAQEQAVANGHVRWRVEPQEPPRLSRRRPGAGAERDPPPLMVAASTRWRPPRLDPPARHRSDPDPAAQQGSALPHDAARTGRAAQRRDVCITRKADAATPAK